FIHGNLGLVVLDLLPDQLRDLVRFDLCHKFGFEFPVSSFESEQLAHSIRHLASKLPCRRQHKPVMAKCSVLNAKC
ncbi:MAG TPA: hypothetical protein VJK29_21335, partial [Terriglobales bacterium]|nr:hypothetical protein [Terriglobales bacterium]